MWTRSGSGQPGDRPLLRGMLLLRSLQHSVARTSQQQQLRAAASSSAQQQQPRSSLRNMFRRTKKHLLLQRRVSPALSLLAGGRTLIGQLQWHPIYLQRREPEEWTRLLKLAAADAEILSQGSDSHDRFVPRKRRKTQSFVWQHCHLKKSTNGAQWYCNICTGNGSLPPGSWGK